MKSIETLSDEMLRINALAQGLVKKVRVYGRVKSQLSTVINQIRGKNLNDTIGITTVVETEQDCYSVLEAIKRDGRYTFVSDVNDMITSPKKNGYSAIHLVLRNEAGRVFEVQIKTARMLDVAENGSASHNNYKMIFNSENEIFKNLFSDKKMKWKDLLSYIAEADKSEKVNFMDMLIKYSRDIGFDVDQLLLNPQQFNHAIIQQINKELRRVMQHCDGEDKKRIEKYIRKNEELLNSKKADKKIIKLLRRQTYYFIVSELLKSNFSSKKVLKKVKELGQSGVQAFEEIAIMMGKTDFALSKSTIRELRADNEPKIYLLSSDGSIEEKPKRTIVIEILDCFGIREQEGECL